MSDMCSTHFILAYINLFILDLHLLFLIFFLLRTQENVGMYVSMYVYMYL